MGSRRASSLPPALDPRARPATALEVLSTLRYKARPSQKTRHVKTRGGKCERAAHAPKNTSAQCALQLVCHTVRARTVRAGVSHGRRRANGLRRAGGREGGEGRKEERREGKHQRGVPNKPCAAIPEDFGSHSIADPSSICSLREFQLLGGVSDVRRGAGFLCQLAGAEHRHPIGLITNLTRHHDDILMSWPSSRCLTRRVLHDGHYQTVAHVLSLTSRSKA